MDALYAGQSGAVHCCAVPGPWCARPLSVGPSRGKFIDVPGHAVLPNLHPYGRVQEHCGTPYPNYITTPTRGDNLLALRLANTSTKESLYLTS